MRWALLLPVGLVAAGAWCLTDVGARAGENKGAEVKLGNLNSKAPASWKQEKTSNRMRAYQFRVPGPEGGKEDAQLVIFYFGQGGAGTAADNVKRWKGMFEPPTGKTIDDVAHVKELKVGGKAATYADIEGTYLEKFPPFDPNAKVTRKPNYRRLGLILPTEDGPYFITLTGPARTVAQNQKGFDEWLKAFK
jgi:hypothetical protein